ncbi:MAG: rhodanese-like domain-containing protein [Bacteroidetes bacterium SW_9_63_38]|nr:MAG: rhodanese-like domain-containing protein [Bacteroidetes bacterium SW_9_63_38]
MRAFTVSALCALALQLGCSDTLTWRVVDRMIEAKFPGVPTITTDSLAHRLADTTATRPVLLDARSPDEYAVSHLPGAQRISPDADPIVGVDTLSRDTPIVVYCSVGYRSARVTARLRKQGFTNVTNLNGSIFRWADEGRTVVRDGTPVRAVHPYNGTWGVLLNTNLHPRPQDSS